MIKLARSEFLISSGIDKLSPDYGTACALLNKAVEDQVRFQTLMKVHRLKREFFPEMKTHLSNSRRFLP